MPKIKTRNKFEKRIYEQIVKAKVSFKYEQERIPYILAGYYLPDFVLDTPLGKVYVETKGYFRPEAKRKMKAVKVQRPELDIRILFYSSKPEYIRWATKNGFRWAVGEIPEEWFLGL